jgi:hypothetical protein
MAPPCAIPRRHHWPAVAVCRPHPDQQLGLDPSETVWHIKSWPSIEESMVQITSWIH